MFAIYNNFLYRYIEEDEGQFEIVTYDKNKIDSSFLLEDDIYYKGIPKDDKNIQDVYNLQFFLEWDSGFNSVEKTWEIMLSGDFLVGDQIELVFAKGNLPGWKVQENTVCSRYVDINECKNFSVVYTYTVKDRKVLSKPLVVKKEAVPLEDFRLLMHQHESENI